MAKELVTYRIRDTRTDAVIGEPIGEGVILEFHLVAPSKLSPVRLFLTKQQSIDLTHEIAGRLQDIATHLREQTGNV